jgi:catechol 2,3-dioxygenase-like lactoylglutathione lyase family enzyme
VIATEGLTHIQLTVRDLNRSLAFYRAVFGMDEMFRDGPHMVFIRTPGARDTITLNADPALPEPVQGGVAHFGFRLKDATQLDAAIATVQAAGGTLIERGEHAPGSRYAYVADPDGYVIEL